MKSPALALSETGPYHCIRILLHLHISGIHPFSFTFQILTLEQVRIELTKSPAEIKTKDLRITTTEYILDKKGRF